MKEFWYELDRFFHDYVIITTKEEFELEIQNIENNYSNDEYIYNENNVICNGNRRK